MLDRIVGQHLARLASIGINFVSNRVHAMRGEMPNDLCPDTSAHLNLILQDCSDSDEVRLRQ